MSSLVAPPRALRNLIPVAVVAGTLLGVAYVAHGAHGLQLLSMLGAAAGVLALLRHPEWGPSILVGAAVAASVAFSTGSEVTLNVATLLIPALWVLWLVHGLLSHRLQWTASPADRPWLLFLFAGLLSLGIGRATWDPAVPVKASFIIVQLAQWAIFAFAALAYWLPGMLLRSPRDLRRMTWALLWIGGGLAILRLIPGVADMVEPFTTVVYIRAPFLVLITGLAGGQLLFNTRLGLLRRLYLIVLVGAMLVESTFLGRLSISEWVGVWTVMAILVWQRFPRLRWVATTTVVVLLGVGLLFPSLYSFAGGDLRWGESGASRVLLIGRVLGVTAHNPLTGLGPAAYRPYTAVEPLPYVNALWFHPQISAHNNYVDIYAQVGLLGLGLFTWLAVMLWRQAAAVAHLRTNGFETGYAHGMVAAWIGSLVIMALADWLLPFVYNIGFDGFQASILVWLFLGGLTVVDRRQTT